MQITKVAEIFGQAVHDCKQKLNSRNFCVDSRKKNGICLAFFFETSETTSDAEFLRLCIRKKTLCPAVLISFL